MEIIRKLIDFFTYKQLPVPQNHYEPSHEFIETVLSSQAQGSVSLGDGRLNSKKAKDKLYDSLKDYNFIN
jgi:hypothetical protein